MSTPPSGTILSKRKCYRKKIVSIGPVLANGQGADGAIFGPDEENGMDRKWIHITITAILKFANPIISMPWKREAEKLAEQPSQIEEGYRTINQGFYQLSRAFAMI